MKHIRLLALAAIVLVACAKPADVTGDWQGKIEIAGSTLRIVFHVTKGADGKLAATMDSPDQNVAGIAVSSVSFSRDTLRLESDVVRGGFVGRYDKTKGTIEGKWTQGGLPLPLTLERIDQPVETARRAQEPEPPYPYNEQEVTFENKAGAAKLAGTLTLPKEGAPFPAVLLVTGSGPEDRDEAVFGHRPFLVLADYLTRRGIAVLRYDDRGVGKSTGNMADATSEDLAADALAGFDFLRARPEVDPGRTGILGHSEGGIIAALAASRRPDVGFIVMLAGTGVDGEQVLAAQETLVAKAAGEDMDRVRAMTPFNRRIFRIIREAPAGTDLTDQLEPVFAEVESALAANGEPLDSAGRIALHAQVKAVQSPWFRFFLTFDPATALARVKCPVLALFGSKDVQVSPEQNAPAVERALKAAGNKDYTVTVLPGLNHLFQPAQTGAVSEYQKIETTMDTSALRTVGDWILALKK
jgi:pimeloyl-ACP methyl ester carboxylesterase